jgi:ectoine hydroxylase-related dioxygenase (phytanoyl-CoA dioxygenase family)
VQFRGGRITELIAHPRTVEFLGKVFGDGLVLMSYDYARSEPGHPGVSFHTDGQPYGSAIFGAKHTCPVMIRVLYYLDDLTPEVSPFRVIPRSHLSLHAEGNPYNRYDGHPGQVMVTAKAGSAVFLNYKVFHGNFPNRGDRAREMLALAYRPAWAGPLAEVEDWDRAEVARLSPNVQKLMGDRNQRRVDINVGNKPADMRTEAPALDPGRWDRP